MGWLEIPEGNWLYKPDELQGEFLDVNEVEIKYIQRKT